MYVQTHVFQEGAKEMLNSNEENGVGGQRELTEPETKGK